MLFPWVGLFEQMRFADVWVHYDDVQLSRSSFTRRVQIKTSNGPEWLTIPLSGFHRGQSIREVRVAEGEWRAEHLALLGRAYANAPHASEMLRVANDAYSVALDSLADVTIRSMETIRQYFGLAPQTEFVRASELGVGGAGSDRILEFVRRLGGDVYVTGHGAKNYLEHDRFEAAGISVRYLNYALRPYQQLHGAFTPFVSSLDLIANVGEAGAALICSDSVDWRTFLAGEKTRSAS